MAIRLRVREIAEAQGLTLNQFQRRLGLSMSTSRRMWYGTSDGREHGDRLKQVSLDVIEKIADYFAVAPGALLEKVAD